jgi:hypothetical protein
MSQLFCLFSVGVVIELSLPPATNRYLLKCDSIRMYFIA